VTAVAVPSAPPLATIRAVPLMHAGQWNASSGIHEFSTEDLAAAVAALDCPAVRRPALKFGHDGKHGVGLPALGSVDNLALDDDGRSVLSSAYPDRSVEGEWDYVCQIGHLHPFVVHAVALLGEERPAIGTLPSLTGLAELYGVALGNPTATGTPVVLTIRHQPMPEPNAGSGEGSPMPSPNPPQVAATVTTEDVRRAYYDAADWEYWITEIQLDPQLQLIVTSDRTGDYTRVPVLVDGDDVSFGDPVAVQIVYVDKESSTASASAGTPAGRRIAYASRAESRPGARPATAEATSAEPAAPEVQPEPTEVPAPTGSAHDEPGNGAPEDVPAAEPDATTNQEDDMSLSAISARLGLGDDADEAAVLAALDARLPEPDESTTETPEAAPTVAPAQPEPVAATAKLPPGVVVIDEATLGELRRNATLGAQAAERQRLSDRDRFIDAAVNDGKISPARKDHWVKAWEADPDGTKDTLASLEAGLVVPVAAAGVLGDGDEQADELHGFGDGAVDVWARQLGIDAKELSRG
jgi:hypothetical protein